MPRSQLTWRQSRPAETTSRFRLSASQAPGPRGDEDVHEPLPALGVPRGGVGVRWQAQAEVVDQHAASAQVPAVGTLVDDLGPEHGEVRHHLGQRHRLVADHLEPQVGLVGVLQRLSEAEPQVVRPGELVGHGKVGDRDGRRVVGGVGLAELDPPLLAGQGLDERDEVVVPASGRRRSLGLDAIDVDLVRGVRTEPDDEEQPGQHRLADQGGELQLHSAETGEQDVLDPQTGRRVVPVARQVDDRRREVAVVRPAQEHPGLAALPQGCDRRDDRGEFLDAGLEEFVAGVGRHHLAHSVPAVGVRLEPAAVEQAAALGHQHRDVGHRLGVGRRGQQAEEAPLAEQRRRRRRSAAPRCARGTPDDAPGNAGGRGPSPAVPAHRVPGTVSRSDSVVPRRMPRPLPGLGTRAPSESV